ncbi:MAG: LamG-like jellyroll fold domain-containing protein, partial [Planctomycetota bacterium]
DIAPARLGDGFVDWKDFAVLAEHWLQDMGLVAHWRLDEADGLVARDSAGGHDGSLNGDPVWRADGGWVNGAIQLDGIDDYVSAPFVLNPAAGTFSAFAWVRGGAPGEVVISQTEGTNWLMADASQGKLMTALIPHSAGRFTPPPLVSESIIADGIWHRIGVVWTGSERILYADDAEVARDVQPSLAGAGGGLNIGAHANLKPGSFFSGLVDDIRIYDLTIRP